MAYPLRIAWSGERIIRPVTRLMRLLTRRGVLVEEMEQSYPAKPDADGDKARTPWLLQAVAVTYRIAFGPPDRSSSSPNPSAR